MASLQNGNTYRQVLANTEQPENEFCDNKVITSKYTILNFVFKFLWSKFRYEFANQYFLAICILQSIPAISITGGIPSTAAPLAFVLAVDGFFTAIQDYNRHMADRNVNVHSKAEVLRNGGTFQSISWQEVAVGDIVKVRREERFPCDMVMLGAVHEGEELNNKHRRCHVNTKDLDGENNLKMRKAVQKVADLLTVVSDESDLDGEPILQARLSEAENDHVWAKFRGRVECEGPNGDLDGFNGKIFLDQSSRAEGIFLEKENLLLRSTQLRNCAYVYGLAVYTGYDSKINYDGNNATAEKQPSLSKRIDRFVYVMFAMQTILCIIGAIASVVWQSSNRSSHWYLDLEVVNGGLFFIKFFTFFLLMSQMVPISLYVSIKISRQAQKYIMDRDVDMAVVPEDCSWEPRFLPAWATKICSCCQRNHISQSPSRKTLVQASSGPRILRSNKDVFATEVRTMELNDELGQITHIFSDKTGTMTCNDFKFRQMSIDGAVYGEATTQIGVITARANAKTASDFANVRRLESLLKRGNEIRCNVEKVKFLETDGAQSFSLAKSGEKAESIKYFLYNLALDHTVELEPMGNMIKYSSASPDEEAFVYAAKFFKYRYKAENADIRVVEVDDPATGSTKDLKFRMLALLPFSSARGMMSVLLEDLNVPETHPKRFVVFSKGADNAIGEKLSPLPSDSSKDTSEEAQQRTVRLQTERHIKAFGADGLRAMAFAMRPISKQVSDSWLQKWSDARSIRQDTEKKTALQACMDELEKDMTLQGATAIEDKLQDEVAETIATLSQANIKIYMLTGDKEETAINIGYGVNMLTSSHEQHKITLGEFQRDGLVPDDEGDLLHYAGDPSCKNPEGRLSGVDMVLRRIASLRYKLVHDLPEAPQALIVDKDALAILLEDPNGRQDLLYVAEKCVSVICCRCRPKQKRHMLELIKSNVPNSKCLAIGDGANDVEMITAANVGVGILGAEGSGAANSSDYKVPQFKVLKRLLLVHGRWNYNRMGILVLYMFYKNLVFVLSQFWYSIYTGWSGQKFYIELATQTYNLVYTGLPVLLLAVTDQDVDQFSAQTFPHLYRSGQRGKMLSVYAFCFWIISACYESLVTYFFVFLSLDKPDTVAATPSVFEFGTYTFTAIIIIVSVRLAMHTHMHHPLYQVIVALCALCWIPCAFIFDRLDANGMQGAMSEVFSSATFWLTELLITFVALSPVGLFMVLRKMFKPTYTHWVRDMQVLIRKAQHGDFESTPDWQIGFNSLIEPLGTPEWQHIEEKLLLCGVARDVDAIVASLERDRKHFHTSVDGDFAERANLGSIKRVPVISEETRRMLKQRLIASGKAALTQFGKIGKVSTMAPMEQSEVSSPVRDRDGEIRLSVKSGKGQSTVIVASETGTPGTASDVVVSPLFRSGGSPIAQAASHETMYGATAQEVPASDAQHKTALRAQYQAVGDSFRALPLDELTHRTFRVQRIRSSQHHDSDFEPPSASDFAHDPATTEEVSDRVHRNRLLSLRFLSKKHSRSNKK